MMTLNSEMHMSGTLTLAWLRFLGESLSLQPVLMVSSGRKKVTQYVNIMFILFYLFSLSLNLFADNTLRVIDET